MKEETTEALETKLQARKNLKKAAQFPMGVGVAMGVLLMPFGMWLDDYMPIYVAGAIVLTVEFACCWLSLAIAASFFDHLQSEDESNKIFNTK